LNCRLPIADFLIWALCPVSGYYFDNVRLATKEHKDHKNGLFFWVFFVFLCGKRGNNIVKLRSPHCHPERSEGAQSRRNKILGFAQNDRLSSYS